MKLFYLLHHLQSHLFFFFILTETFKIYNWIILVAFQISTITGELRYVDALRLLYTLEDASKGLAI